MKINEQEERLIKIIQREMKEAVGLPDETLSAARTALKKAYLGEQLDFDKDRKENGWSTYVDRSVLETVEWAKPGLLRVFASGDEIIRFEPRRPEHEPMAEEATDYINQVVFGQSAFKTIYDVISDALYQRVGWLKVWWDEKEEININELEGLSEEEALAALMSVPEMEKNAEVEKITSPQGAVYNLRIKHRENRGGIKITALPSERVIWSKEALDMDSAHFVAHWEEKTKAELIEEGYPRELVLALKNNGGADYPEQILQEQVKTAGLEENENPGWAARIKIYEAWLSAPDEKGLERYKVVFAGSGTPVILKAETWSMERPPLFPVSSVPLPHDVAGLCLADLVADIQKLRTEISRQLLDALAGGNQSEIVLRRGNKEAELDLDQFLNRRIGGVYEVLGDVEAMPLPIVSTVAADAAGALALTDKLKESRTGIGQQLQGLSADALQNTATGAQILDEAINQRLELIARILAENLFKPAGAYALKLAVKHQAGPMDIRLRGKFNRMNPKKWDPSMEVKVSVGLGTGNQGRQVSGLQIIIGLQEKIIAALGLNSPVKITNVIKSAHKLVGALGFKAPEQFFGDLEDAERADQAAANQPQQENQGDPAQELAQMELAKSQAQIQAKAQESQARIALEREKAEAEQQMAARRLEADILLEQAKMAAQLRMEQERSQAEAELNAMKELLRQNSPEPAGPPEVSL